MKKFLNVIIFLVAPILLAASFLSGCAMGNTSIAQEDANSVASKIIPGKTTQSEVLQIYGQPMYKQMNSNGTETWTYSTVDTSFKTYVPFAPLVTGNDGTKGKDLSVKFSRAKIVISQDFTHINNSTPTAETSNNSVKTQKSAESPPPNPKESSAKPALKRSPSTNEFTGAYENRSESEFVFTLQLNKNGLAIYEEPDFEGGKPIKLHGRWQKDGDGLVLNFGKNGIYRYAIKPSLSWAAFGCKGESFGLENRSTPKSKSRDANHDVWRKADLKAADKCQHI